MCFSPFHPNLVIGGTYSGQIVLWDTRSRSPNPVLKTPLSASGHTHPVYSLEMVGTQNAHSLISASTDGTVCAWTLDMLARPQESLNLVHPAHTKTDEVSVTSLGFPLGETTTFWVGTEEGNVYSANRYDRAGAKAGLNQTEVYRGHSGPVTGMSFHPVEGRVDLSDLFLTCGVDWTIKLWRAGLSNASSSSSGNAVGPTANSIKPSTSITSTTPGVTSISPLFSFEEADDHVYDVKWHPHHPALFGSVDGAGKLALWNLNIDTEVSPLSLSTTLSTDASRSTPGADNFDSRPTCASSKHGHCRRATQDERRRNRAEQARMGQEGGHAVRGREFRRSRLRVRRLARFVARLRSLDCEPVALAPFTDDSLATARSRNSSRGRVGTDEENLQFCPELERVLNDPGPRRPRRVWPSTTFATPVYHVLIPLSSLARFGFLSRIICRTSAAPLIFQCRYPQLPKLFPQFQPCRSLPPLIVEDGLSLDGEGRRFREPEPPSHFRTSPLATLYGTQQNAPSPVCRLEAYTRPRKASRADQVEASLALVTAPHLALAPSPRMADHTLSPPPLPARPLARPSSRRSLRSLSSNQDDPLSSPSLADAEPVDSSPLGTAGAGAGGQYAVYSSAKKRPSGNPLSDSTTTASPPPPPSTSSSSIPTPPFHPTISLAPPPLVSRPSNSTLPSPSGRTYARSVSEAKEQLQKQALKAELQALGVQNDSWGAALVTKLAAIGDEGELSSVVQLVQSGKVRLAPSPHPRSHSAPLAHRSRPLVRLSETDQSSTDTRLQKRRRCCCCLRRSSISLRRYRPHTCSTTSSCRPDA